MRKTALGNHFGYIKGYYVFIYKRPHGKWCCRIGRKVEWLWQEGYHGTSLPTLKKSIEWALKRIRC